jgi:hypothetical protein
MRSPCAEQTASTTRRLRGRSRDIIRPLLCICVSNAQRCMHLATDIIFVVRERASDYDVFGDERSEAVTACTPRGLPGP